MTEHWYILQCCFPKNRFEFLKTPIASTALIEDRLKLAGNAGSVFIATARRHGCLSQSNAGAVAGRTVLSPTEESGQWRSHLTSGFLPYNKYS